MIKEISIDLSDVKRPLDVAYSPEEYPGFKGETFRATIKGYTISLTRGLWDNDPHKSQSIWGLAFGGEGHPGSKTLEEMQQMLLDDIPEERTHWDDSGLRHHVKGGRTWWTYPDPHQGITIRQFNKHFIAVVQNGFGGGEAEFYKSLPEARDASFIKAREFHNTWSHRDGVPPILAFSKEQVEEVEKKLISGNGIERSDGTKVLMPEGGDSLVALTLKIAQSPEAKGKVLISNSTFQKIGWAMERVCSLHGYVGNHEEAKSTREVYSMFKDSAEKIDAEEIETPTAD